MLRRARENQPDEGHRSASLIRRLRSQNVIPYLNCYVKYYIFLNFFYFSIDRSKVILYSIYCVREDNKTKEKQMR